VEGVAGAAPVKPASFAYETPGSVDEALALLLVPGAMPLAGGQSLVPLMNFRFARPSMLIDLNRVRSLESVSVGEDGSLVLGALTRQALVERSPLVAERCPLLAQACGLIGHAAIRSRGTIGGSVAHAALGAELPVALLALDAIVVLKSLERGSRRVPAREFFRGPMMTSRAGDELIVSVEVPDLGPEARTAFTEYARTHGDFAVAGAAVVLAGRATGSIAMLGAGHTPVRAPDSASEALVSDASAAVVGELAAAGVADDYRRALLSSLVARAVEEVRGRA
jgi:aerobic carbon-monoxide dehydrogenase medium subunit